MGLWRGLLLVGFSYCGPTSSIDLHMLGLELTPLKQNISTHPSDPSLVTYVFFFFFSMKIKFLFFSVFIRTSFAF